MIWKLAPEPPYGMERWRRFFCLWPREIETDRMVWLEFVERLYKWEYRWRAMDEFRLTEKQKIRIGEKW